MEVHTDSGCAAAENLVSMLGRVALTDEEADGPVDGGELGQAGQPGRR